MAKMPAFQFYPGDWRKDPDLSRASLQAKGAMIEIMCLAFECEKRGILKTGGKAWSIDDIAMAIGGNFEVNKVAIRELIDKKILKKDKKGGFFSKRMVMDEALFKKRREGGKLGGIHGFKGREFGKLGGRPVKKPPSEPPSKPAPSSSSSSSIKENNIKEKNLNGFLTEQETSKSIEYCDRTFQRKYDITRLQSLWKAFLIHTGEKYYSNRNEKISHFQNWIKMQPYKQNQDNFSGPMPPMPKTIN